MKEYKPIGTWLRQYLPTFCWQTAYEIVCFLEGIDEDVNVKSVLVTLGRMTEKGVIIHRRVKRDVKQGGGLWVREYRRV